MSLEIENIEWGSSIRPNIFLPLRGYKEEIYAANTCLLLAQATGGRVTVFHVEKKSDKGKYDYWNLIDNITPIAARLRVEWEKIEVTGKSAREETTKHLKDNRYDLIIMGTQKRRGFPRDLRKSNAITLAELKDRPPILIIQAPTKKINLEGFQISELEEIMFPFRNGDPLDNFIIRISSLLMSSAGVGTRKLKAVKIVKVPELMPPSSAKEFLTDVEEDFLRYLSKYSVIGQPISPRMVVGHSWVKTMIYILRSEKPSLAVIGIRGNLARYKRKISPIWRISKAAKIPVIFVIMPQK